MFIQVGYGLEGVLPDVTCKRIIEDEIIPRFRNGDVDAGMSAGVQAMLAAAKGEYHGTGQTVAEKNRRHTNSVGGIVRFIIALIGAVALIAILRAVGIFKKTA